MSGGGGGGGGGGKKSYNPFDPSSYTAISNPLVDPTGYTERAYSGARTTDATTPGQQQEADNRVSNHQQLIQQIQQNPTIDEYSRQELLKSASKVNPNDPQGMSALNDQFQQAQAGQGVYAARIANKARISIANDTPGRQQTLLSLDNQSPNGTPLLTTGAPYSSKKNP